MSIKGKNKNIKISMTEFSNVQNPLIIAGLFH